MARWAIVIDDYAWVGRDPDREAVTAALRAGTYTANRRLQKVFTLAGGVHYWERWFHFGGWEEAYLAVFNLVKPTNADEPDEPPGPPDPRPPCKGPPLMGFIAHSPEWRAHGAMKAREMWAKRKALGLGKSDRLPKEPRPIRDRATKGRPLSPEHRAAVSAGVKRRAAGG